ncbi:hypothetical protein SKAU_G00410230 [Synaphobranchus kaupii]|uniref:Uncharacterized protein n=1 Tax=Synaphobranchus kaupii TaxID=118154 RepID=A0A9Q1IBM2_SYNKA|nr:hypothetical protein SKAU_G00410230 [Synaphobranchus kaupii]
MVSGGSKAGRWQTVQGHMQSGALRPKNFGDPSLSSAATLEHIPSSAAARPRTLVRAAEPPAAPHPPAAAGPQ